MEDRSPVSLLNEVSYGNPSSVEPERLIAYLDSDDPEIKTTAAEGLARLGTTAPERVQPYATEIQGYLEATEGETFANLLAALSAVAQQTPSAVSLTIPVVDGLHADNLKVREWSALLVAYVGGPPATKRTTTVERLERLTDDENASVRRNAALGLARLRETDALQGLLSDRSDRVRRTAEQILQGQR
jgi:HEAT repeat protein